MARGMEATLLTSFDALSFGLQPVVGPTRPHQARLPRRPDSLDSLRSREKSRWSGQLSKPNIPLVDLAGVVVSAPQYEGLPLSAIVADLGSEAMQHRMLEGLAKCRVEFTMALPSSVETPVDLKLTNQSLSAIAPSHILCIQNYNNEVKSLIPCHTMPLISFCSTIPSLPRDYPTSSPLRALPIIPLRLPSPETFIIIRDYIYTHSKPLLVTSLLAWTKGHRNAPARLSQLSAMELMRRARIVYGVYSNACKVGLADEEFWKCLQLAWKIILMALVNARKA